MYGLGGFMTLKNILESVQNNNVLGELLRELAFSPTYEENGLLIGCYEHFNINKNWKECSVENLSLEQKTVFMDLLNVHSVKDLPCVYKDSNTNILMSFVYDSDGTLVFLTPDQEVFVNYDCKKNYNWERYEV